MAAAMVMAAGTTELLVALVAGLFGVLAGASAAAVITTNHERNEQFRARMIESAEQVIVEVDAAMDLLKPALRHAEGVVSLEQDRYGKAVDAAEATAVLKEALSAKATLARTLDRLVLIHPDPRVRTFAPQLAHNLDGWARFTELVIQKFEEGEVDENLIEKLNVAAERERYAQIHRERFLEILQDEIFGYGTFGYWVRKNRGTLRREAMLTPEYIERAYQSLHPPVG